jgi:hypothetical protein
LILLEGWEVAVSVRPGVATGTWVSTSVEPLQAIRPAINNGSPIEKSFFMGCAI